MKKKIFAPVFASVVALSSGIVSFANPVEGSYQNQGVDNVEVVQMQEYKDIRFKEAVVKDGVAVNVRTEQVDGQVQNVARSGETFKVLGSQGDWLKVQNGSLEGWMSAKYLDLKWCDGYVDVSNLNFRAEEGTDSEILSVLDSGTAVTVLEDNGEWIKVKLNEQEGYLFADYVTDESPLVDQYNADLDNGQYTQPSSENNQASEENSGDNSDGQASESNDNNESTEASGSNEGESGQNSSGEESNGQAEDAPSSDSSTVQSVLNLAYSKQGLPYVWGAEGPNSFDCSGFTKYVFRNAAGINIPRTSKEQANFGQTVSRDNLQAGDMVFFTTDGSGKVSHVGIYVGGGNMIHAPSSGKNIKVVSIESAYYSQHYVTAKRVL